MYLHSDKYRRSDCLESQQRLPSKADYKLLLKVVFNPSLQLLSINQHSVFPNFARNIKYMYPGH